MKQWLRVMIWIVIVLVGLVSTASCTSQDQALQESYNKARNATYYIPKNDIERNNYNMRQEIADDPTTILWCTSAFPVPSSPLFTVPIVGKLTSGAKRPYLNDPGPDGMYGSSGEYRYGFGPAGKSEYVDFYGIATFCTTTPKVWQRESTVIIMENDPQLLAVHEQARAALLAGNTDEAQKILADAVGKLGKK